MNPAQDVFTELHPPLMEQQAVVEASRCLECGGPLAPAPCVSACPTGIDIPRFIKEIREGRPLDAARTIFAANILGGTCARVCPVEELCEGACVLKKEGRRPVSIGRLQRYATDWALDRNLPVRPSEKAPRRKASIGVIGAGPAGLACAAELARLGYRVTVYERRELPGGLVTYGIAPYKQRYEPLPQEIETIRQMGVEFRFGVTVGVDISFEQLEQTHEAIFLGIGLGEDVPMEIEGEHLKGVWNSLEFIEQLKWGRLEQLQLGERVVVIGGGNTAIDVARESVRLGAREVVVLYRRTEEQMPAYAHEVQAAKKEGVQFRWLVAPLRFIGDTRVRGVECIQMRLSAADSSGRPRPEPVPGTEFIVEADTVIKAIGQRPQKEFFEQLGIEFQHGVVKVNERFQTSREKYFAGGDCINGGGTVVEAVQHGKLAARGIHRFLSRTEEAAAAPSPVFPQPVATRDGRYYQGDFYLAINRALCKGCALCVNSCPTEILFLDNRSKIAVRDISRCVFCGLCEARCPDFAIWIEKPNRSEVNLYGESAAAGSGQ